MFPCSLTSLLSFSLRRGARWVALSTLVTLGATYAPSMSEATPRPYSASEIISKSLRPADHAHVRLQSAPVYRLQVALDLDLKVYEGALTLELRHEERHALNELNFLLYPNSAELSSEHERRLIITHATLDGEALSYDPLATEVLQLKLPRPIAPGELATIKLGFKGTLYPLTSSDTDVSQMGLEQLLATLTHTQEPRGGYGVFSFGEGVASMALWYPILVAYDERGWDISPSKQVGDRSYFDVAHFDVTLITDEDVVVATTGVEVESKRLPADPNRPHLKPQRERRYLAGGAREFTLQASRDYIKTSASYRDVMVNSYALKGETRSGQAALQEALSALESFEELFGPYPYTELDIAQAPLIGGAGGVEFPGLITIGSFLYHAADQGVARQDEPRSKRRRRPRDTQAEALNISGRFLDESRDFVIAHEVAHQWWSALVGNDSRAHPFIDEALANYSAASHFHRTRGPQATRRQMDMMMRLNYHLARLSGMADQPVDQPTEAFKDALSYGAIVYGKGALYFWSLRSTFGAEALERGLKSYVRGLRFGVAEPGQLLSTLREASGDPARFDALTARWLEGRFGDEDIEGVSLYQTLKLLMGDQALAQLDPKLRRWASHRGVDALAELLEGTLRGEVDHDKVDYEAIITLLEDVMEEEPEVARWVGVLGRALSDPDATPSDALHDLGRELSRDDPRLGLAVQGMGLIFEALTLPPPEAPRAKRPARRAPPSPKRTPQRRHRGSRPSDRAPQRSAPLRSPAPAPAEPKPAH